MTDAHCLSHTEPCPVCPLGPNGYANDANDANDWPKPISVRRRARVQGRALRRLGVVDARSGCRRGGDADRARSRRLPASCGWLTPRSADRRRVSGVLPWSGARTPDPVTFVSASRPQKPRPVHPKPRTTVLTASLLEGAHPIRRCSHPEAGHLQRS